MSSNSPSLSNGAIQRMIENDKSVKANIQVLEVKKNVTEREDRYRLVITDGKNWIQSILSNQGTQLIIDGSLKKHSICKISNFICNEMNGKKVIIIFEIQVLQQLNYALVNASELSEVQSKQPPPAPAMNQRYTGNQQRYNSSNSSNSNNMNNHSNSRSNSNVQPISSLNPYQNNWRICVRCTAVSAMRNYHTQRGEGKLFSVDFLDRDGGEIRAVMFNNAADKFFPVFKDQQCYYISRGSVRINKKGYSHIKNQYQITLNDDAIVEVCQDINCQNIEKQKFNFESIGNLSRLNAGQFVDVIGVVIECSELQEIHSSRTQQSYKKRSLKICDSTAKVSLTLWGTNAEMYDEQKMANYPILACKACKISDFGGKSLSAGNSVLHMPTFEEAVRLQSWFDTNGNTESAHASMVENLADFTQNFTSAPKSIIAEILQKEKNGTIFMDTSKRVAYFSVVGTITTISHSTERLPWYKAVPKDSGEDQAIANAKVVEDGMGKYRCPKNGKLYNGYTPRYILRFSISDFSGKLWLTAFNDHAQTILGKSAEEMEVIIDNGNTDAFDEVFNGATFQRFIFRIRAREDSWEDQVRIRYGVQSVREIDFIALAKEMEDNLQMLKSVMPASLMVDDEKEAGNGGGNGDGFQQQQQQQNYGGF